VQATRLIVMAAAYAAGAAVVSWAVAVLALAGVPTVAALVLKALLVTGVLVVVTWRGTRDVGAAPHRLGLVALAALVGFAADPFTWAARTYLGQLVLPAGAATLVVDLVAWTGVVVATAAVVLGRARAEARVGYA